MIRKIIIACLLFVSTGLSACLTGTGSTGIGSNAGSAVAPSGVAGNDLGSGTLFAAKGASGEGDTMSPRADSGDILTWPIYVASDKKWTCEIEYVASASIKVLPGFVSPLPPIVIPGATLDGHFYAQYGEAPRECEDASCWTWTPLPAGHDVRLRLSRPRPSGAIDFYADSKISGVQSDGSNAAFSGLPVVDEDEMQFFYIDSSAAPYGFTENLSPLTDDLWEHWEMKCLMGSFRIQAPPVVYKKATNLNMPSFENFVPADTLTH